MSNKSKDAVGNTTELGERACFVGVDGGGTKTCALVLDAAGTVLGRSVSGASNQNHVGAEAAARTVNDAIAGALLSAQRAPTDVCGTVLAMAGVDRPGDAERIAEWLVGYALKLYPQKREIQYKRNNEKKKKQRNKQREKCDSVSHTYSKNGKYKTHNNSKSDIKTKTSNFF